MGGHRGERSTAALLVVGVVVLALGLIGTVVVLGSGGDDDGSAAAGGDGVPAEEAAFDMFAPGRLESLLRQLDEQGVPGYLNINLYPERADAQVQIGAGALQYDAVSYDAGGLGEREASGQLSGEDRLGDFFTLDEFDPAVVASIAEQADDVAGLAGRGVSHMIIERDSSHGIVIIRAYVEGDAYGSGPMLVWDGTGQHLLDDGRDT